MDDLPIAYLARHGETAWSLLGKHTGQTDIDLTARGEAQARAVGHRLEGMTVAGVLTSPLKRAARTCELARIGAAGEMDHDLVEWDYGDYEGQTSAEICAGRPGWLLWRDGCPGGETPEQVGARADLVIERVRSIRGPVLLFSSGYFLRVLAARWLGLRPSAGRYLLLETASLSIMGFDRSLSAPVIRLWNDTSHLADCGTLQDAVSDGEASPPEQRV